MQPVPSIGKAAGAIVASLTEDLMVALQQIAERDAVIADLHDQLACLKKAAGEEGDNDRSSTSAAQPENRAEGIHNPANPSTV